MDEIIIRVVTGSASPSEEESVLQWRAQSPENDTYFRHTAGVWSLTTPSARETYEAPVSIEAIVGRDPGAAEAQADPSVISLVDRLRRRSSRAGSLGWAAALAASVAAVALGVRVIGVPQQDAAPTATFVAEVGSARTVVLDDGSFVRLSPGSRLEQWAGEGERRLNLTGKAFFAVTHDPDRPFVVGVGASEIRVLGTRFELFETAGELRTVVVEGMVDVSNDRGRVDVPSGDVALVSGDQAPSVSTAEDVYALLDWPEGLLVFQATPLAQVADEVARHFGRPVEVRGAALGELRISAFFEAEGFEEVVQALCDVSGAECALTERGAFIGPGR